MFILLIFVMIMCIKISNNYVFVMLNYVYFLIVQALHERGEALHRTQDATANMLSAAETYGDTMKRFREKYHLTDSH